MLKISVVLLLVVVVCANAGRDFEILDVNDEEVVKIADKAAYAINKKIPDQVNHKLVKVVYVFKREFADDTSYIELILILGRTTCKKQEVTYEEAKQCDIKEGLERIQLAIITDTQQMLKNTWREIEYRLHILRATNGAHVQLATLKSAYQECTVHFIPGDPHNPVQSYGCKLISKSEI